MFTTRTNSRALRGRIAAAVAQKPPRSWLNPEQMPARPARKPVFRRALAILSDGQALPVIVKDLSAGGARIHYEGETPPSGRVLISEPTTPMHVFADLVWRNPHCAGVRFAR
jgi:hypothetical protein